MFSLSSFKAQKIINDHIQHRNLERLENPERFDVKPTLGEKCLRRPPPQPSQPTFDAESTQHTFTVDPSQKPGGEGKINSKFYTCSIIYYF